ncbi:hypothetical protein Dacet_1125 [Denitrovibrio acetiphilus DSM 12809]|uniref:Uncharacterized protein n=1 Tax=Denitrovibrio acetiphilus (strain DSM 12809 / NBRC 114555 / N2460) TaxID=522772 RepID=D4H798_DENA2|nr:hypothetical protein [Denitrovibrio acetiphilus]ADD67897.1 hypothetical protein Dacet_1125 [Denitrovibrio acetiphilus DSM 12809]
MASTAVNGQNFFHSSSFSENVVYAAPNEQILDRVYDFPEALPEKAMDMVVEMASDDSISNREMDYIYFIVVTLPLMATSGMFKDQKNWFLKENRVSFKDYIRYRLNKLNYMSVNSNDQQFCERIRQLLWRFSVV